MHLERRIVSVSVTTSVFVYRLVLDYHVHNQKNLSVPLYENYRAMRKVIIFFSFLFGL